MALRQCPDCGKQISDTAPTCISCGLVMARSTVNQDIVVERKGGKYELFGTLMILASMGGCAVGMATTDASSGWFGFGVIGFLIGIVVFIYGRFF